jgi:hypothetical protein
MNSCLREKRVRASGTFTVYFFPGRLSSLTQMFLIISILDVLAVYFILVGRIKPQ